MEIVVTSSTTVRLGQISTAQRAAEAAGVKQVEAVKAEPSLAEIPF
jgi:hypothetical protein